VRDALVDRGLAAILANLLDNALRASPISTPVHLFVTQRGGRIHISITDQGSGMNGEEVARAFEPGFSTRRKDGGCGIGLALSREIARELEASIELSQLDCGGTCAVVEVPFRSTEAP
jgi:signal transduction histidine kinase